MYNCVKLDSFILESGAHVLPKVEEKLRRKESDNWKSYHYYSFLRLFLFLTIIGRPCHSR